MHRFTASASKPYPCPTHQKITITSWVLGFFIDSLSSFGAVELTHAVLIPSSCSRTHLCRCFAKCGKWQNISIKLLQVSSWSGETSHVVVPASRLDSQSAILPVNAESQGARVGAAHKSRLEQKNTYKNLGSILLQNFRLVFKMQGPIKSWNILTLRSPLGPYARALLWT